MPKAQASMSIASTMEDRRQQLSKNLEAVQERIGLAADKANRQRSEVCLVAVTKYVDAEVTRDLVQAGCLDLGESRPQQLWSKAEALADLDLRWHQIGHLQRNKLRRTLPLVSLIHSVDSERLLNAIDDTQAELDPGAPIPILLEVNTSGDKAKHGFGADGVRRAVELSASKQNIRLRGLMCMAGFETTPEQARREFDTLRAMRDQLQDEFPNADLSELSMGMSGDFEVAIAAGATLVRVGSLLFDGIV